MKSIENLPLHDAIIERVEVVWSDRIVKIQLKAFTEKGKNAVPHSLQFDEVTNIQVPHESPWGDSVFINGVSGANGTCKIEMQSGDLISISATSYKFKPSGS